MPVALQTVEKHSHQPQRPKTDTGSRKVWGQGGLDICLGTHMFIIPFHFYIFTGVYTHPHRVHLLAPLHSEGFKATGHPGHTRARQNVNTAKSINSEAWLLAVILACLPLLSDMPVTASQGSDELNTQGRQGSWGSACIQDTLTDFVVIVMVRVTSSRDARCGRSKARAG